MFDRSPGYLKYFRISYYRVLGMNGKYLFFAISLVHICCLSFPELCTIIRQDERAAYYYIVLSGLAIPTYRRDSDGVIETLSGLKRGSTFGVRICSFANGFVPLSISHRIRVYCLIQSKPRLLCQKHKWNY